MICMIELGQLEKQHEEFAKRKVRVVVISNDDQATAQKTQKEFPHLAVVADTDQNLAKAIVTLHPGMAPGGADTNAPMTVLTDGTGQVRWIFRPDRFIVRLPPADLLAAVDRAGPK
jgi:peroxiredoxin